MYCNDRSEYYYYFQQVCPYCLHFYKKIGNLNRHIESKHPNAPLIHREPIKRKFVFKKSLLDR